MKSYLQEIIQEVINNGGTLSQNRLQTKLGINDVDFQREIEEAISLGVVKIGRGRGGVLNLVKQEHIKVAEDIKASNLANAKNKSTVRKQKKESATEETIDGQENEENSVFGTNTNDPDAEWQKKNYEPLPPKLEMFKPGMYVVRPPSFMEEAEAWKNLRHYVVTHTDGKSVYVRNRYNMYAEPQPNSPEGFYKPVQR